MNVDTVLKEALVRPISREEAFFLFRKIQSWDRLMDLFKAASKVRDDEVGYKLKLMGFISRIAPCRTEPVCKYCFRWRDSESFSEKAVPTTEQLKIAAKALEERGMKSVSLGGGTDRSEEGRAMALNAAKTVCENSKLKVWAGSCSFLPEDIPKYREIGVEGITCNLETINENVYKKLRPGESLELRKKIIEATEAAGLGIDNTLMVGLGWKPEQPQPYEDWVEFFFYFKRFKNLRILEVHPFRPIENSPVQAWPPGSVFEAEKARAIARLIFRDIDISGGRSLLSLLAGANLDMHCYPVSKASRAWREDLPCRILRLEPDLVMVDNYHLVTRAARELGMEIE